jgi:hypothetical protein
LRLFGLGAINISSFIFSFNMKKFIFNIIIFILPIVIFAYSKSLYLLYSDNYINSVAGPEVYHSIIKSKLKSNAGKVLIGDSFGLSLFSNITCNDTINSLACNRAISMAGHFFLLNNYLNAGNQVDTVYMIFTPFSFLNNLDEVYTYNYFLKPFYKEEYMPLFTKTVYKQIHKIPYYYLCREPNILTSKWSPNYNSKGKISYTFLSTISVEYLSKIKELSSKNDFKIIILPTPTRISNKVSIENINKNEIVNTGLENEFENYFKNLIYLNDTNFIDNVHLKNRNMYTELVEYYKTKLMK